MHRLLAAHVAVLSGYLKLDLIVHLRWQCVLKYIQNLLLLCGVRCQQQVYHLNHLLSDYKILRRQDLDHGHCEIRRANQPQLVLLQDQQLKQLEQYFHRLLVLRLQ